MTLRLKYIPYSGKLKPIMNKKNPKDQSTDLTQDLNIRIPSRLVERVETYASETGTTFTNVVIEALAIFLREQKKPARLRNIL